VHAQHAQLAEFQRQVAGRQLAVLEPLLNMGTEGVVAELRHRVTQQPVLAAQVVTQIQQIQTVDVFAGHGATLAPLVLARSAHRLGG
jgi:hypothetical protein